ncbi:MAG TPA: hypothetical protein VFQ85_11630 [Mycobacteriales bacterium]|nr:hypothetical protein [Mycobacteriales bacterium]
MRLRPALLCAALALGAAAFPARAAAPARPDPCTVSYAAPTGDGPSYYAGPTDPDVDVTGVTWRVTATDVVVVARVAKLADRPAAAWGDEFEAVVDDRASGTRVSFGYFRSLSGGGPTFFGGKVPAAANPAGATWSAYPGGPTHLLADFDLARSQVTLTIPRTDLETAFGKRLNALSLTVLGVNTYLMDPAYDPVMADWGKAAVDPRVTTLNVAACDRWLAARGARAPAASPCAVSVVAVTGDETSRTSDVVPTRDDSVDVARVTYAVTAKDVVVTIRLARLTDRPLVGTGQGYHALFVNRGQVVRFGVTRDAASGTTVRQVGGRSIAPGVVRANVDTARSLVTLTVPRAALATAFLLKDTRSLVLSDPGAVAFWTANGESFATADGDAAARGRVLSFAACDRAARR